MAAAARLMASILIPALVEATFREAQTLLVEDKASGRTEKSARSLLVNPFCTNAEKPPIKSIPSSSAALSNVSAMSKKPSRENLRFNREMGVTATLVLIIGTP